MDNIFLCSKCEQPFTSKWPSSVRYRLRKNGKIFCSKSCASMTHGAWVIDDKSNSEYRSWKAMKSRCDCKSNTYYARYGGRGITYDPNWNSFEKFLEDLGPKENSKLELERIDNEKGYYKENCRWVTHKEQTRNRGGKRATRLYTFEGKTMCIADWAEEVGISPQAMQKRLNKNWPLERALNR
jgi:hypothetical protein